MSHLHPGFRARHFSAAAGFTLIELLVVIALVAILAALAAPSFTQLQSRNAIRASVNEVTLSLQFARSEAVRLNSPVTFCPSNDGVACTATGLEMGWIVRTGPAIDAAGQQILQDTLPKTRVRMDSNLAARRVTFLPNGFPVSNFAGGTISICPAAPGMNDQVRSLVLNRTGRITLTTPGACPF